MNKAELISNVSKKTGRSKREVSEIVCSIFDEMYNEMVEHNDISIREFGTFKAVKVAGRMVRDIHKNESYYYDEHFKVKFVPSKKLKSALLEKNE